jgi:DNA-binding transcriptional regulator YiaG
MTITEIRALTGLNKTKFAALYGIPYRTLQDWESGKNKPPTYVELLLEKVVRYEFEEKD